MIYCMCVKGQQAARSSLLLYYIMNKNKNKNKNKTLYTIYCIHAHPPSFPTVPPSPPTSSQLLTLPHLLPHLLPISSPISSPSSYYSIVYLTLTLRPHPSGIAPEWNHPTLKIRYRFCMLLLLTAERLSLITRDFAFPMRKLAAR